ncbi:MAG: hypothetical protein ACOYNL_02040 [Rickettsiales bacterium]
MRQITRQHRSAQGGFTMVVIAALFAAFSVIAAIAVERASVMQFIAQRNAAVDQLTRISNAMIEYGVVNKTGTTLLYPCPAPDNVADTAGAFGASTVNCYNAALDPISGVALLGGDTIRGMVPVQTLAAYGIGFNDAFDPWNNRIVYVVNRRLTLGSPTSAGAQATNPAVTSPIVTFTIQLQDFVLISYGKDGLGGIKRGSTTVGIACTNGTATYRYENCDNDTSLYTLPTNTSTTATSGTYFDDIVTHYRQ